MSNVDNDEPPILAKFGSVIVDHEGSQLIQKTCIYIVSNCLICLFGVFHTTASNLFEMRLTHR